jgi:hypothetical protein
VRIHGAIEINAAIMTTNRCAWASVDNPLMLEYHDSSKSFITAHRAEYKEVVPRNALPLILRDDRKGDHQRDAHYEQFRRNTFRACKEVTTLPKADLRERTVPRGERVSCKTR